MVHYHVENELPIDMTHLRSGGKFVKIRIIFHFYRGSYRLIYILGVDDLKKMKINRSVEIKREKPKFEKRQLCGLLGKPKF